MFKKNWILAVAFVLAVPALSIAQEKQKWDPSSINTVSDCTLPTTPPNLVANCTFQLAPDFVNWTNGGDPSFTAVVPGCGHRGTNCASMGQVNYNGTLTQGPLGNFGQTCTLSFWLDNSGQPSRFSVEWSAKTVFLQDSVPNFFPAQQFSVSSLPGGGTLTFTFYNPPSFMHLSDVAVTCLP